MTHQQTPSQNTPLINEKKPVCLITGASAGIGRSLAESFAKQGWDLVLCARRKKPMNALAKTLKELYGTKSTIISIDLSAVGSANALITHTKGKKINISGLVNNAGWGMPGSYLEHSCEDHATFLQLMLTTPCELTRLVLPDMREHGFGRIINVASLAALIPSARGHTLYAATKSALIKFSQSLHLELNIYNIHTTALCPGFTYTEFHDVNQTRKTVNKLPKWMWKTSDFVAEYGFESVTKGRVIAIPGIPNKTIALCVKLLPEWLTFKLMAKQSQKIRYGGADKATD